MRIVRLIGALVLLGSTSAMAQMRISFEENRLIGTGITPGRSAVWFAVEWTQGVAFPIVTRVAEVAADESGRGVVELDLSDAVPPRSLWFLVDMATGDFVGGTPNGDEYRESSTPELELDPSTCGTKAIVMSHEIVEVLLVRPTDKLGVWFGEFGDGSPLDQDGVSNGVISACVADLAPLGGAGPTPSVVQPGDTVVVIDSETFECSAKRVRSGS